MDQSLRPSVEFQILKAEHDNLKSSYDRLWLAYDAWHEKTAWIHKTIKPAELGQHIADVMTARLLYLRGDAELQKSLAETVSLSCNGCGFIKHHCRCGAPL